MSLLSRIDFVSICSQAILLTRDKIAINNQLSGYLKYHQEIKEKNYFLHNVREPLIHSGEHEYMYRHDLLKHTGLGNCNELADFLLVEIGNQIDLRGAVARMRVVESKEYDHVYLEIRIQLKGEKDYSYWEVDAWDPRIIDISPRPNGSIKNQESLDYGYSVIVKNSIFSDEIDYGRRYSFFTMIPKPKEGSPSGNATPPREILDKHGHLYDDHSLEDAIRDQKIAPEGELHYLQQPSFWQN